MGREKPDGEDCLMGGGGGDAGARGTTLARAAKSKAGTALNCGEDGSGGGSAARGALGAGGGADTEGPMPRDDGGGGMREVGSALPAGRGTTLTGRGTTLTGAGGIIEAARSGVDVALGSFSSPIVALAQFLGARRL